MLGIKQPSQASCQVSSAASFGEAMRGTVLAGHIHLHLQHLISGDIFASLHGLASQSWMVMSAVLAHMLQGLLLTWAGEALPATFYAQAIRPPMKKYMVLQSLNTDCISLHD